MFIIIKDCLQYFWAHFEKNKMASMGVSLTVTKDFLHIVWMVLLFMGDLFNSFL